MLVTKFEAMDPGLFPSVQPFKYENYIPKDLGFDDSDDEEWMDLERLAVYTDEQNRSILFVDEDNGAVWDLTSDEFWDYESKEFEKIKSFQPNPEADTEIRTYKLLEVVRLNNGTVGVIVSIDTEYLYGLKVLTEYGNTLNFTMQGTRFPGVISYNDIDASLGLIL